MINSAKDTSFVVYCIDLETHRINAVCYGAGYDRELIYHSDEGVYVIEEKLTKVSSSTVEYNVIEGDRFESVLTAHDGCSLQEIKVTMGETDVTASVVKGTKIEIEHVTGNVCIYAEAKSEREVYNQIRNAVDVNGVSYADGIGYKQGYRFNSKLQEVEKENSLITGFIPYSDDVEIIRIKGFSSMPTTSDYFYTYDEAFAQKVEVSSAFIGRPSELLEKYPQACSFEFDQEGVGTFTINIPEFEKISNTYPPILRNSEYIRFNISNAVEEGFVCTFDEEF